MKQGKWTSTKTYPEAFPVAYRQWRADRKSGKAESEKYTRDEIPGCNAIHGYALTIHLEFSGDTLDRRNWICDFGGFKPLKDLLDELFDHTLLLASDDPHYNDIKKLADLNLAKITEVEATGCEALADFLYNYLNGSTGYLNTVLGYDNRVWCSKVEVRETSKNSAFRVGDGTDVQ